MRFALLTILMACGGDILLSTRYDEKTNDTTDVVVVEDTVAPSPTSDTPSEPSSSPHK